MTSPGEPRRRVRVFLSVKGFPFVVLLALCATSILCRGWLIVRPFLIPYMGH